MVGLSADKVGIEDLTCLRSGVQSRVSGLNIGERSWGNDELVHYFERPFPGTSSRQPLSIICLPWSLGVSAAKNEKKGRGI